jgi:hypothetical protein
LFVVWTAILISFPKTETHCHRSGFPHSMATKPNNENYGGEQ